MKNSYITRWKQITEFKDFFRLFIKEKYSFKVGIFHPNRNVSFKASGYFFNEYFPDHPAETIEDMFSPLGIITKWNIRLNESLIYDSRSQRDLKSLRQGNIYKNGKNFELNNIVTPQFWILSSHSCANEKSHFLSFNPVYSKENFLSKIESLIFKKKWDQNSKDSAWSSIWNNQNMRFIPLPSIEEPASKEGIDEDKKYLIVDLGQMYTFKKSILEEMLASFILSFEGLSYYQNRVAIQLFRDLEEANWDDDRVINSGKVKL